MVDGASAVGVVFVSFHSERLVEPAAAAYRDAGFVVRVVDNSGTYPTSRPSELVRPGRNVGFGAGCNMGVAALPPSVGVVCFHNPDVDPAVEVLAASAALVRHPGVVAVAPCEMTDRGTRATGYAYPSPVREAYLVARFAQRLRTSDPGGAGPVPPRAGSAVPGGAPRALRRRFPAFCFVVIDRSAFRRVGGFDERYVLYAEDLDLWHRLQVAGTCLFDPGRGVVHHVGTGSTASAADRELLRWLGVELFAEASGGGKWHRYRWIHRAALPTLPPSPLVERLRHGWRDAATPTEVAQTIRLAVEGGALELSG